MALGHVNPYQVAFSLIVDIFSYSSNIAIEGVRNNPENLIDKVYMPKKVELVLNFHIKGQLKGRYYEYTAKPLDKRLLGADIVKDADKFRFEFAPE